MIIKLPMTMWQDGTGDIDPRIQMLSLDDVLGNFAGLLESCGRGTKLERHLISTSTVRNLGKLEKLISMVTPQTHLVSIAENESFIFIAVKCNFYQIYELRALIFISLKASPLLNSFPSPPHQSDIF